MHLGLTRRHRHQKMCLVSSVLTTTNHHHGGQWTTIRLGWQDLHGGGWPHCGHASSTLPLGTWSNTPTSIAADTSTVKKKRKEYMQACPNSGTSCVTCLAVKRCLDTMLGLASRPGANRLGVVWGWVGGTISAFSLSRRAFGRTRTAGAPTLSSRDPSCTAAVWAPRSSRETLSAVECRLRCGPPRRGRGRHGSAVAPILSSSEDSAH